MLTSINGLENCSRDQRVMSLILRQSKGMSCGKADKCLGLTASRTTASVGLYLKHFDTISTRAYRKAYA